MKAWKKILLGIWGIVCGIIVASDNSITLSSIPFFVCGILLLFFSIITIKNVHKYNITEMFSKTDSLVTDFIYLCGIAVCFLGTIGIVSNFFNLLIAKFINNNCYVNMLLGLILLTLCDIFHYIDYDYKCSLVYKADSKSIKIVLTILGIILSFAVTIILTNRIAGSHHNMTASEFASAMERANVHDTLNEYSLQKWGTFFSLLLSMLILSHYWKAIILSANGIKKLVFGVISIVISIA